MKQNINILVMIGVLILACGKLQGVTVEQFSEAIEQIQAELAKSPDNYQEVDFSKAFTFLGKVHKAIPNELDSHQKEALEDMAFELEKRLAHALFINLIRLAGPITEQIDEIIQYIKVIEQTSTPFTLDNSFIKDPITNEINPRLDFAFQKGLLSNPAFVPVVEKEIWEDASQTAMAITASVINLLNKLTTYVQQLNKISKTKKEEEPANDFTKDHFNKTAQAILIMKWVTNNLYSKLKYIFPKKMLLISDLTSVIDQRYEIFSELKYDLYRIYEVRGVPFGLISIKSYFWPLRGIYYSYPQNDPLEEIPPDVAQIKSEQLKQPPVEEPSAMKKLGAETAALRAIERKAAAEEEIRKEREITSREAIIAVKEARIKAVAAVKKIRMEAAAAVEETRRETVAIEEETGKKSVQQEAAEEKAIIAATEIEKKETRREAVAIEEETAEQKKARKLVKAAIERKRRRNRRAIEEQEEAAAMEEEEEEETEQEQEEAAIAIEEKETIAELEEKLKAAEAAIAKEREKTAKLEKKLKATETAIKGKMIKQKLEVAEKTVKKEIVEKPEPETVVKEKRTKPKSEVAEKTVKKETAAKLELESKL